ncbi:hypothetical protein B0H11DRAFT_2270325 [Mycena galericulata]|nr:hypothetical protein B0H11DRAFT_2270325 [Mycena galericulata]
MIIETLGSSNLAVPRKAASSKSKKLEKGSTRAQIEALTKKAAGKTKAAEPVVKKVLQSKDAAAVAQKAGLSQAWTNLKHAPAKTSTVTGESPKLGGLNDAHARASRPNGDSSATAPPKNKMVAILVNSDTEETPSRPADAKVQASSIASHPTLKSESSSSSFTPASTFEDKGCLPCALFEGAVSRIQEHRGAIAKYVLNVVDRSFEAKEYYKNTETETPTLRKSHAIADDAKYALRDNGPAFHKHPTPQEICTLDPKKPAYIKPTGFLESEPIIETLSWFIKDEDFSVVVTETPEGDVVDFSGLPTGALGMVAAAVERGYRAHITGVRAKAPDFVAGFIAAIKKFKCSRWESILASAGSRWTERAAEVPVDMEPGSLDGVREHMYISSSP